MVMIATETAGERPGQRTEPESPILSNLKKIRLPEAAGEVRQAMLEVRSGIIQHLVTLMETSENDRVRAECAKAAIREVNRLFAEYDAVVNQLQFSEDQRQAYLMGDRPSDGYSVQPGGTQGDSGEMINELNSTKKENAAPAAAPGAGDARPQAVPPHVEAHRAEPGPASGLRRRPRGSRRLG